MIIGFKGESSKLKNLYKELGLKEVKVENFDEIVAAVKANDGNTVIVNYNDIMVFENPTADLVEKRMEVNKALKSCKKNVFIGLAKNDPSLDKVKLDIAISTSVDTKDMKVIEELFQFLNTDLAYSGKLSADEYAVKLHSDLRAEKKSLAEIKKLIK